MNSLIHSALLLIASVLASAACNASLLVLRTASQDGLLAKFDIARQDRPGICIEIMSALQRIDPALRFTGLATSMATARIEYELQEGNLDVFLGFLKTPEREQAYVFIEPPLFTQNSRLAVRRTDKVEIKSFDDVRRLGAEGVILSTQGTAHVRFLRLQPGLRVDDGARNSEANLQKLMLGRGRFFYQGDLNLSSDIQRYGYADKVRILPVVLLRESQYIVFSRRVPQATIARVQKALLGLQQSGQLDAIYARYAPTP